MIVLKESSKAFPTKYWNDSCDLNDLDYAISNGCVGATTNPVIVKEVIERNLSIYKPVIEAMVNDNKDMTEDEVAWKIIERLAVEGAKKLEPIFNSETGEGRISIQTNTKYFRSSKLLIEQAIYFSKLAPNIQVKIPATSAGIVAIEEAIYLGISVNATVCFSVPQAVAVAEAVENALERRRNEGKCNKGINAVCTIMVGRTDDYIKKVAKNNDYLILPEALEWAGIASAKRYYNLYIERNYKTKLLTAAFRNIHHWTALLGGDLLATIPTPFQVKINNSKVKLESSIDKPIAPEYMECLLGIPEFVKAYDEKGMDVNGFDSYGATVDTLSQFFAGYDDLVQIIRKFTLK